jgi:hypothetical protein
MYIPVRLINSYKLAPKSGSPPFIREELIRFEKILINIEQE